MSGVARVVRGLAVPPEPWANGLGLTRPLWEQPVVNGSGFEWRLSIADLVTDAPFSRFPGVDRTLLPLDGGELRLVVDGRGVDLARGCPVRFPGEAEVRVEVGAPGRVLNLMSRRGSAAALAVRAVGRRHRWTTRTRAVVVLEGEVDLGLGVVLTPYDVAIITGSAANFAQGPASTAEVTVR
jgi:environmental stress-induced protein Ves